MAGPMWRGDMSDARARRGAVLRDAVGVCACVCVCTRVYACLVSAREGWGTTTAARLTGARELLSVLRPIQSQSAASNLTPAPTVTRATSVSQPTLLGDNPY